jgi:hypothetical protein
MSVPPSSLPRDGGGEDRWGEIGGAERKGRGRGWEFGTHADLQVPILSSAEWRR